MGYYFERADYQSLDKDLELVNVQGAHRVTKDEAKKAMDDDKGVFVCMKNGLFDAVAYCYDKSEFDYLYNLEGRDFRAYSYFVIDDRNKARSLVGL